MAVFKNAIALEHEGLLTGEFDVTFDCKPQRYLAIGEELTEIGAWGNTETAEGEVVTIDASSDTAVKALTADISPIQDLHGYDSPWVGGAGKNKLPSYATVGTTTVNGITFNISSDGTITANGTATANAILNLGGSQGGNFSITGNEPYILSGCPSGGSASTYNIQGYYRKADGTGGIGSVTDTGNGATINIPSVPNATKMNTFILVIISGYTANNLVFKPMIRLASVSDATFAPYENICQISGHDDVTVTVADDVDNPTVSEDYTTTLPSTTYGGTLDVVSGTLKPAPYYASYNGEALEGEWVSDRDKYVAGTTPTTGAQVVNIGKVGTATQLTGQSVELLEGENHIFADSGNVTVEYGHNPTLLTNPTWFPSKPLLAVEGYGEIKFNNRSIVDIESGQLGDITIANNISSSSIQIDGNLFNIGDTVTVSGAYQDIFIELKTDGTYYNIVRESESITDSNSDFSTAFFKDSPGTGQLPSEITYRITIPSFNITIGTDKTITDVVSGTISCKAKNPSANTFTATFTTTREYKYKASTNTITYNAYYSTVSTTAAYVVDAWLASQQVYFGSVVGHSTVSQLGNPTYIDCDIGEAYMIKDGEPISLNQYIDLGSDLPTLPPGDTEVTYDNTITKVEVKPNWWKV